MPIAETLGVFRSSCGDKRGMPMRLNYPGYLYRAVVKSPRVSYRNCVIGAGTFDAFNELPKIWSFAMN